MSGFLVAFGSWLASVLTGGTLDKILNAIDKSLDKGAQSDQIKAEVIETWIKAQANLLVGRTWWFQLFFVIPLGIWWTSVILDSVWLKMYGHTTSALPPPLDSWAGWIVSALFLVDGTKAVIGRFQK